MVRSAGDSSERLKRIFAAKLRGDTEYLVAALRDPEHRDEAAKFLGEAGEVSAISALIPLLQVRDPQTRAAAAIALGQLKAVEAVPMLIDVTSTDDTQWVREWSIQALGEIGDARAVPPLIELLRDDRPRIRKWAAVVLGRLHDPAALDALREARKRERWYARRHFRRAEREITRKQGNRP